MNWMKRITLAASALTAFALPLSAQTTADTASLLVVYGVSAPSSEGDVDHREQILFSIPENTPGRVYVRLFDPETSGNDDFTYGGPRDSLTTYRIMGGEGAFTGATRPAMVQERERPARISTLATVPGKVLAQSEYGYDKGTDGRWVILIGQFGWLGFLAEFVLLVLPVFFLWRETRFRSPDGYSPLIVPLSLILAVNVFDMLPNATLTPLTWLMAGALTGYAESLRRTREDFASADRLAWRPVL